MLRPQLISANLLHLLRRLLRPQLRLQPPLALLLLHLQPRLLSVPAPRSTFSWAMPSLVAASWSARSVSYTHLTLPTICSV